MPKTGNDYDYATLTECAKRLKNASADFKDETQVTITANPGIDYQTLIRAIDALRRYDHPLAHLADADRTPRLPRQALLRLVALVRCRTWSGLAAASSR